MFCLMTSVVPVFAESLPENNDELALDDDLPPTDDPVIGAPIDNWVGVFFIIGTAYVFYACAKRNSDKKI